MVDLLLKMLHAVFFQADFSSTAKLEWCLVHFFFKDDWPLPKDHIAKNVENEYSILPTAL